jgi:tRNA-dihydrouridine synthase
MKDYAQLKRPFFVLAPMDDVTDTVFRQTVADCAAPDLFFTEFANVDGLQSPGRPRILKKLRLASTEHNVVAQLWGINPENFYKTARQIVDGTFAREFGLPEGVNFVGIDLNMGCPAKSEVKAGACSALIKNPELASKIIKATQKGVDGKLPVSVKTRLGFSEVDMSWPEFLLSHNLAMLTMHGRTRKQMSKVPADWEKISEVREIRDRVAPQTLIVGNGDVESREQGEGLAKKYNLDGIMVGRGIFKDPFLFATQSPWESYSREQRIKLFQKQVELFKATWQNGERPIAPLNKFCKVYVNGFDGAKELREQLMHAENIDDLLNNLKNSLG